MATVNPVTYLLERLRAIISDGWVAADLGAAVLAVLGVGVVSMGLALATLRGRVNGARDPRHRRPRHTRRDRHAHSAIAASRGIVSHSGPPSVHLPPITVAGGRAGAAGTRCRP